MKKFVPSPFQLLGIGIIWLILLASFGEAKPSLAHLPPDQRKFAEEQIARREFVQRADEAEKLRKRNAPISESLPLYAVGVIFAAVAFLVLSFKIILGSFLFRATSVFFNQKVDPYARDRRADRARNRRDAQERRDARELAKEARNA